MISLIIIINFLIVTTNARYYFGFPSRACDASDLNSQYARWLCDEVHPQPSDPYCIYAPLKCRFWHYDTEMLEQRVLRAIRRRDRHMASDGAGSSANVNAAISDEDGDRDDETASNEIYTMYFAGDSRLRGLVLYIASLALGERLAYNVTTSPVYKCWGRWSIEVGRLRLVWHEVRALAKDEQRQTDELAAKARAHFRQQLLLGGNGVFPDALIIQYGFDLISRDMLEDGRVAIQLTGFPYWKNGRVETGFDWDENDTMTRHDGFTLFDTRTLVSTQLDSMCDEGTEHRKHFHSACGRHLCGNINGEVAQILLNLVLGAPPRPAHALFPKAPPVNDSAYDWEARTAMRVVEPDERVQLCWQCRPSFSLSYHLELPELKCQRGYVPQSEALVPYRRHCVSTLTTVDGKSRDVQRGSDRVNLAVSRAGRLYEIAEKDANLQEERLHAKQLRRERPHWQKIHEKIALVQESHDGLSVQEAKKCLKKFGKNVNQTMGAKC